MVRAGSGQEPQAMKRNCHFFCVCLLCLFVAYCICLFVCWAINAPDDGKELPDQRFHNEENYHFSELLDRNDDAGDDDETGRKWGQQREEEKKSGNAGGRKRSTARGGSHSFPPITGLTEFSLTEFSLTEFSLTEPT